MSERITALMEIAQQMAEGRIFPGRWDVARDMEDEVARTGKTWPYLRNLTSILRAEGLQDSADLDWGWALIRATPEQRAKAFLAALDHTPTAASVAL